MGLIYNLGNDEYLSSYADGDVLSEHLQKYNNEQFTVHVHVHNQYIPPKMTLTLFFAIGNKLVSIYVREPVTERTLEEIDKIYQKHDLRYQASVKAD